MLYKYMKKEFASKFFHNGSLKIGTLYEYKRGEHSNAAIDDEREGSHYPVLRIGNEGLHSHNIDPIDAFFICGQHSLPFGSGLQSLTIQKEIKSDDCYIYCLTTSPNAKAMMAFNCDTCIEISNPVALFRLMTKKIRHKVSELSWEGEISYQDKEYNHRQERDINPATTKDLQFSYQNEYRVIWKPNQILPENINLNPLYINVPDARKFCRIIKLK